MLSWPPTTQGSATTWPGTSILLVPQTRITFTVCRRRPQTFPNDLTREWVSIGHSQGGGAAYELSEYKLVQDDSRGYLNDVSIAPITKLYVSMAIDRCRLLSKGAPGIQHPRRGWLGGARRSICFLQLYGTLPGSYHAPEDWTSQDRSILWHFALRPRQKPAYAGSHWQDQRYRCHGSSRISED